MALARKEPGITCHFGGPAVSLTETQSVAGGPRLAGTIVSALTWATATPVTGHYYHHQTGVAEDD